MNISQYFSEPLRHCPKYQAIAAKRWLEARQTELLPIDYYHLVFTLPQEISELAYYNKSVMYDILMKAAAQTLLVIGADLKYLVGGLSLDGKQWISCKSGFFLPVRFLSRLFRRLYLKMLSDPFKHDTLLFFGDFKSIENESQFTQWLNAFSNIKWVVYANRPFSGQRNKPTEQSP